MDPVTMNLLIQGGTALVSLGVGWLLRHVSAPAPDPQHPLLSALEQRVWATLAQQVAAQTSPPASAAK